MWNCSKVWGQCGVRLRYLGIDYPFLCGEYAVMVRKPRVHFPGALYHVIVRGNKGQKVFRREADFKLYLRLLGEYKEVFEFALCAYALMPTHVHLLVEARGKPLSGLMQRLQFRYTRNYNIR